MVKTADGTSSDDEVYAAVDLISDSDEDETALEQAEEQNIIGSENEDDSGSVEGRTRQTRTARVALTRDDNEEADAGLAVPAVSAEDGLSDSHHAHVNTYFASEMESFNMASKLNRAPSEAVSEGKRVRFQEETILWETADDSDSSSDDDYAHPFLSQDCLDPEFRSLIEDDEDEDDGQSSENEAGWDGDHQDVHVNGRASYGDAPIESDEESSGYESEEGETTDEDLPPPQSMARTRSVLRRLSASSVATDDDDHHPSNTPRRPLKSPKSRRLGPSLGSWIADPTKPIAVIDSSGTRLVVYPAQIPPSQNSPNAFGVPTSSRASTVSGSPYTPVVSSRRDLEFDRGDLAAQDLASPTLSVGASVMEGVFRGTHRADYHVGGAFAPHHTLYPLMNLAAGLDTTGLADMNDDDDDDDDDGEMMLNVDDFIDFGDDSSDGDNGADDQDTPSKAGGLTPSNTTISPTSRKRRLTTGSGVSHASNRTTSPTQARKKKSVASHKRMKSF